MAHKPLNIKDCGNQTWYSVREWAGHLLKGILSHYANLNCLLSYLPFCTFIFTVTQAHYFHIDLLLGFGNVLEISNNILILGVIFTQDFIFDVMTTSHLFVLV